MADVRACLRAFAGKRVTTDHVMRVLASHDEWLAPVDLFTGTGVVDPRGAEHIEVPGGEVVLFSQEYAAPAGVLRLFSDREAAARASAAGAALGPYGSKVPAAAVFAAIPERFQSIKINDLGPLEEFWFIGKDAFPLAELWAEAIAVERALAAPASARTGAVAERIARFPHYLICVTGEHHALVGLPDFEGHRAAAVVMTAPDCRDRFRDALPSVLLAGMQNAWGDGSSVFAYAAMDSSFDAVVFNPAGPAGPITLARDEVVALVEAAPTGRIDLKLST